VIASALAVPTGALFTDEVVVAEVRLSYETLQQIKREGREASRQAAERLASRLEPLIWQEATRPPVDVSAGARPKAAPLTSRSLGGHRRGEQDAHGRTPATANRVAGLPRGGSDGARTDERLHMPGVVLAGDATQRSRA
jgi:hypothetical protein